MGWEARSYRKDTRRQTGDMDDSVGREGCVAWVLLLPSLNVESLF